MKKWFVFYTKSRHEKKVLELLTRQGFEAFLPMQKVMKQWSDRKKKVEVPLFNSYIFVRDTEDRIPLILQTPGISWNIRHNDKPAVLHDKEYDLIQRFLSSGLFLEASSQSHLEPGDRVRIVDGPLRGVEGHLIKRDKQSHFVVYLESFTGSIQVNIEADLLQAL